MTFNQLFLLLSTHREIITYSYLVIFLFSLALTLFHTFIEGNIAGRLIVSFIVHVVTIPGIFITITLLYQAFFLKQNLMNLDVFVYFLPVIAMICILIVLSRKFSLNGLPGIGRLWGLLGMLSLTFTSLYLLSKVQIFIVFLGSFMHLAIAAVVLYIFLRISLRWLLNGR